MASNTIDYPQTSLELAPIFLVGCPRSGTTLLQQMLDAHVEIAIAPETHFVENFWLKQDNYGDLAKDENYQRLIQDLVRVPEFCEMALSAEAFTAAAYAIERSYANLFCLLLSQFMKSRNVQIVGEKTPNHLLHMKTLKEFFPKSKFIHIVRDPRAVVNSWKKVPWTTGTVLGDAKIWRKYMITAQSRSIPEDTLLSLHYEELVASPESSLRRVCNFLNLAFDANMLNYYAQHSQGVNVSREPWKGNATKPISSTSLTRWQTDLATQEVAIIEAVTGKEMRQLDYSPYAPKWMVTKIVMQLRSRQLLGQAIDYIKQHIL
jgi:hypothetical protein